MTEIRPPNENADEVDERYRRLSDRGTSAPSETVRRAILGHGAELAAQYRTADSAAAATIAGGGRRHRLFRYGGLAAAAALAGLLTVPHFLLPERRAPAPAAAPLSAPAPAPTPSPTPAPAAPEPPLARLQEEKAPAAGPPVADDNRAARSASPPPAPAAAAASPSPRAFARAPSFLDDGTALRAAAGRGDLSALHRLLSAPKPEVDARDASGRTALMLAVLGDHPQAVDTLLAAGANPNAADANGTTPLKAALAGGRLAIATALEQAGAR
jgi:hypothetical protein